MNNKNLNLYKKYCKIKEHALEVEKYSTMLFDTIKKNINGFSDLTDKELSYLKIASILHDIGYHIDSKSHHKHTLDIILNEGIEDLTETETLIVGNIARYHRNSTPNTIKHPYFAKLNIQNQKLVTLLGGILKLADGLDKPHKNLILKISALETENEITLILKTIGFKPSTKTAEKKKDLLEIALNKKIKIEVQNWLYIPK